MPRIEFYVLASDTLAERQRVACNLAMKAWRAGFNVFLRASGEDECNVLDELLWHFRKDCFLPHSQYEDNNSAPVVIGLDQAPSHPSGVLINLASNLSPQVDHFSRVIEIVNQQPELLTACRENFRTYRQRGYDPKRVELQ
ncbi:DNA polymerase III subunit chi [Ectopseudomonas mendocina]|uniref:DNA polymerase III subunit chi n=1 Tax=Ectopseudomonas mendocina TaxID=300 RepID=A0ABZ2RHY0_ECTME